MKKIASVVIILAIIIGFSSISFAFKNDFIEKNSIELARDVLSKVKVNDLMNNEKVEVLVHKQKKDLRGRNVHFIATNVVIKSKKMGEIVVVTYAVLVEEDSKYLGHAGTKATAASYIHDSNILDYERDLRWFQALASNYGNESLAIIALH